MKDPGRIVVVGAGPTGLGAAYRLQETGHAAWSLMEATDHPGGLAGSHRDGAGFTWDIGGHVHFSHYDYYDDVVERVLGEDRLFHERRAWIRMGDRWVPYPFQHNLHRLAADDRARALEGLEAAARSPSGRAANFAEWIEATFGRGIAELFMIPYNRKVWGYPLETLGVGWVGERVAVPDVERLETQETRDEDDDTWGPNRTFFYPLRGGSGATWRGVLESLDPHRIDFGARVSRVDLEDRRVVLADGTSRPYDALISSVPLDLLCSMAVGLAPEVAEAARSLVHSSVHVVGVGLRHGMPEALRRSCWIYFPDPAVPFHRVTVLSNYSPHNVPPGEGHWSLLAEVCETEHRPVDEKRIVDDVLAAMRREGLVEAGSEVVSTWHRREEHGYPTPFLGRDRVLERVLPALEAHGVFSRGRFGGWRYEVSNQDHAFMQGVEVVDRLLGLGEEVTLFQPHRVNR